MKVEVAEQAEQVAPRAQVAKVARRVPMVVMEQVAKVVQAGLMAVAVLTEAAE